MRNRWAGEPVAVLLVMMGATFSALAEASERVKPNIVILVSDDHGYGDISSQGCEDIPTPNIDSLGKNGVRFSDGYVSCPVCSPMRAGLQTGRYQQRYGHEFNPGPPGHASPNFGLPVGEITLADRLKQAGYTTGLIGKWHLGYNPEFHPLKRGYDEFFGFISGMHDYFISDDPVRGPILRGMDRIEEEAYLTEAFAREAAAFINQHKARPFMLMVTFNALHSPLQAPEKYLARFPSIPEKKRRIYAAMTSAMDDAVGQVLDTLRKTGLEENTLIFFLSDNGGPTSLTTSRNWPLRGEKGDVWEGGIRVPFLVQWKGRIPAGKVYDQPVIALDIHPTCIAASGGKFDIPADKALDGIDLLPYLTGAKSGAPHAELYWRYGNLSAVRKSNYKLVRVSDRTHLYDLARDISEQNDLAGEKPEVVKGLQALYDKWDKQLIPPAWKPGRSLKSVKEGRGDQKARIRKAE